MPSSGLYPVRRAAYSEAIPVMSLCPDVDAGMSVCLWFFVVIISFAFEVFVLEQPERGFLALGIALGGDPAAGAVSRDNPFRLAVAVVGAGLEHGEVGFVGYVTGVRIGAVAARGHVLAGVVTAQVVFGQPRQETVALEHELLRAASVEAFLDVFWLKVPESAEYRLCGHCNILRLHAAVGTKQTVDVLDCHGYYHLGGIGADVIFYLRETRRIGIDYLFMANRLGKTVVGFPRRFAPFLKQGLRPRRKCDPSAAYCYFVAHFVS